MCCRYLGDTQTDSGGAAWSIWRQVRTTSSPRSVARKMSATICAPSVLTLTPSTLPTRSSPQRWEEAWRSRITGGRCSVHDTAAMEVVKLGSGVVLYGYYMFHGGTNPEGKQTTLQESQATGYPNDLPVKSYDFQAPLGEFGQMRTSYRVLETLHLFLGDFGSSLATMPSYLPERMPKSKKDTSTPRVAARLHADRGFIFLNNYQRTYPLPEK